MQLKQKEIKIQKNPKGKVMIKSKLFKKNEVKELNHQTNSHSISFIPGVTVL